jgi:hypothetical protein
MSRFEQSSETESSVSAVQRDRFLEVVSQVLERLRLESERRGHRLIASLIDIAKTAAEDDLRTHGPPPSPEEARLIRIVGDIGRETASAEELPAA